MLVRHHDEFELKALAPFFFIACAKRLSPSISESCATEGCPGKALPISLTLLAALIAKPTSLGAFQYTVPRQKLYHHH